MNHSVYINKILIPINEIKSWEQKRLRKVSKKLRASSINTRQLAEFKDSFGYEKLTGSLKLDLRIGSFFLKFLNAVSFGKRQPCTIEMLVEGLTAAEVEIGIEKLMSEKNSEYNLVNLMSCPDHYAFKLLDNNILEVVETTGGSPFPIQMLMELGNEEGLTIPRDLSYSHQLAGMAKLSNGTYIGGLRHQFRDEENGFRVRLAVEFPIVLPKYFIYQHQFHLACEFGNWFEWLLNKKTNKTYNN